MYRYAVNARNETITISRYLPYYLVGFSELHVRLPFRHDIIIYYTTTVDCSVIFPGRKRSRMGLMTLTGSPRTKVIVYIIIIYCGLVRTIHII